MNTAVSLEEVNEVEGEFFDMAQLRNTAVVLVKFTTREPALISKLFRKVERDTDQKVDHRHRMAALKLGLGRVHLSSGRLREGRVDTGEQVIKDPKLSQGGDIIADLVASNRFHLIDMFQYSRQPDKTKSPTYTMVLKFSAMDEDEPLYVADPGIASVIEQVSAMTWNFCSVFVNPDFTQTINFGGLMKGQRAFNTLRVVEDKITVVPL